MKVFILLLIIGISFATILDLNNECEGILFGALPHPDPTQFIGCVQGRGTVFGCDFGLVFDPVNVQCVEEALLTTTDDSFLTTTVDHTETTSWFETTTSWLATTTSNIIGDISVSFRCPPTFQGYIPHDRNCSLYYFCINGVRNLRFCDPIEHHYDIITRTCRSENEAMCGDVIQCVN